ncbi:hypothetical protein SNEBB_006847 [Seison nebaliae]|nr:hypothetical protein SNEBB_006847 [Seison nebaliae]
MNNTKENDSDTSSTDYDTASSNGGDVGERMGDTDLPNMEKLNLSEYYIDFDKKKEVESKLTEEELEKNKKLAVEMKEEGNSQFVQGNLNGAEVNYSYGLDICPSTDKKMISILFQNRAACFLREKKKQEALEDLNASIQFNENYIKAYLKRAKLLEEMGKLDEALADYKTVNEKDKNVRECYVEMMRLEELIRTRNEKMKEEMMGKLKDLANTCLKPFGLSTNNFQVQQDPSSGSYSINMKK